MKRFLLILFAFFIATAYSFNPGDDDGPLKALLEKIQKINDDYPQEKVHIQTDKPYYTIGDSIWFKAYIVNAEENALSGLSKILYVDLINEKDSVKKSLRLPVISGLAWGDFTLTDSLSEGSYRLRAYTNWMRNFGEEYYFDKIIHIGNSFSNQVSATVNYSFATLGSTEAVTAEITYVDTEGKPVSEKEVRYEVELDNRSISKGKGTTDQNGKLIIKFNNKQTFLLKSGRINTTIETESKVFQNKSFAIKATNENVDVQFFPEGGQLLQGLRGRIAFKAVGADGLGRPVKGTVTDNEDKAVAVFKSEHAGMGVFTIFPEASKTYTAAVTFEDGSVKKFPLPAALPSGYSIMVNNLEESTINVRISTSNDLINVEAVTLVAQVNGVVKFVARNQVVSASLMASIPKNKFPTGIVRLTLFSSKYIPLAERLVFVRHAPSITMDISNNKTGYSDREKVDMSIAVKDTAGKPVSGIFSVSVVNESKIPSNEEDETTILSNLLLTSDLKGYVEKPNYYFTGLTETKERHLDILMMTQGWSRFTWKNSLSGAFPPLAFQPERSISISGTVNTLGGKPVDGAKVMVLSTGGTGILLDTVTGPDGRFNFENLQFLENTRFVVQARNAKNKKNVDIVLDRVPPQLVTKSKNSADIALNINAAILPYLRTRRNEFDELRKNGMIRRNIILDEVTISEKKRPIKNSSNLNGAGNADAVITSDRLQSCSSLDICLQSMLAGVVIRNGIAYSTRSMDTPMQIVLDGMYVEPDFLSMISPADVESIEVLRTIGNLAIYGSRGGGGVLIINTKRGDGSISYRTFAPGIITYNPPGYFLAREFYSPNYADPKVNQSLPDLRTTIFWSPNVITDSTGTAKVSYYTADDPGEYKVTAEGLDGKGGLLRKIFKFTVK